MAMMVPPAPAEEPVESLPKANAANPGYHWLTGESDRRDVFLLLDTYHRELISRLDRQDAVLSQMSSRSDSAWRSVGISKAPVARRSGTGEKARPRSSQASQESNEAKGSDCPSMLSDHSSKVSKSKSSPTPPPLLPRLSFQAPKLFTTFTAHNLQAQDAAASVDGMHSRKRFASLRISKAKQQTGQFILDLVRHPIFDSFYALVVLANSVYIGLEVEHSISGTGEDRPTWMFAVQYVFTILFTMELLLRLMADGLRFFCSEDWTWALLDLIIVVSSIWEIIVQHAQNAMPPGEESELGTIAGISSLKAFRIIRITRILKTVQVVRILRFVVALRTLVTSIFGTLKSLLWALVLILLIEYVFAILFTQAVNDFLNDLPASHDVDVTIMDASRLYFENVFTTMLSLFMSIAGGVSWEQVLVPLKAISAPWVLLFLFYMFFTYFAVLNVITGVFCQSAIDSAQNDHATVVHTILANKQAHLEKVRELFNKLGAENTGGITYLMFEEKITSPEVKEYFESLGLDVWDAWSFFKMLDLDDSGAVDIEEFLMGCLRVRGTAKAIDIGKIIHDQTWQIKEQGKFQTYVESELKEIKDGLWEMRPKQHRNV